MLVIVIKGLPEESRLDGRSTPRRLQIPPLRSCGAPVGMTRVGRLRSGRIATRIDGVRSGYSAKTADFDRQSFSALIDGLRFVCPPSVCPPSV